MIKHYLLTTWRNLLKNGWFTIVNLTGLIVGISACAILMIYVFEDLNFNKFNTKYDRIARVLTLDKSKGISSQQVGVSYPALAEAMKTEFAEIEETVRIMGGSVNSLTYQNQLFSIENILITENSLFKIFDFKLLDGNPEDVLTEPSTIVITKELADKIFGEEKAVGQSLENPNGTSYEIVGVVENPPTNSHIKFDVLQAMVPSADNQGFINFLNSWNRISVQTYVLFNASQEVKTYKDPLYQLAKDNGGYELFYPELQDLADIHLKSSDVLFEVNHRKSDITNIYIMTAIGLLILILSIFNYVNLVVAQSANRSKEIGVRKAAGATREQIMFQHLLDSFIQVFIAFMFSALSLLALIPVINQIYQRELTPIEFSPVLLIFCLLLILGIALIAGFYPSVILSGFKPSQVLKSAFSSISRGKLARNFLVVIQFSIATALIASTIVVFNQMKYIFEADLGYNRSQIVTLTTGNLQNPSLLRTLHEELRKIPGIDKVGASSQQIGAGYGRASVMPEGTSEEDNIIVNYTTVDHNYLDVLEIEIVEGRGFSEEFSDSSRSVLINQKFMEILGWESGVGKFISLGNSDQPPFNIIGVISDYHFATIKHEVEPIVLTYNDPLPVISLKISESNTQQVLTSMKEVWNELIPSIPFTYTFLEDSFAELYNAEESLSRMITHFSIIAVFLAMTGLFMFSMFTINQRRKEIGIRKILGASTTQISFLLGRKFFYRVLIANAIGLPVAWYYLTEWIQNFAYSTNIGWVPFLSSILITIILAGITINIHLYRAASENPIKSIRNV